MFDLKIKASFTVLNMAFVLEKKNPEGILFCFFVFFAF